MNEYFSLRLIRFLLGGFVALVGFTAQVSNATTFFVNPGASPGNDGLSWATAFHNLHEALRVAGWDDEIWLRKGVHTVVDGNYAIPPQGPYPDSFFVRNKVTIRGGFDGTETSIGQRGTLRLGDTILSGDRRGNDSNSPGTKTDNAEYVLHIGRISGTIELEGLTIEGAFFDDHDPGTYQTKGCGVYVPNGHPQGSVFISECFFRDNHCDYVSGGAVMASYLRWLGIKNTQIAGNAGGVRSWKVNEVGITDCSFSNNTKNSLEVSSVGGATLTLIDSTWQDNEQTAYVIGNDVFAQDCVFKRTTTEGFLLRGGKSIIEECEFRDHSSDYAISVSEDNVNPSQPNLAEFHDCLFESNVNGLTVYDSEVTVSDCEFLSHHCPQWGSAGGINAFGNDAVLRGKRLLFLDNYARRGGGIRVQGGVAELANIRFLGNRGAGLWINRSSSQLHQVTLHNPIFVGNTNSASGGAIANGGNLEIYQASFVENYSNGAGNAIGPIMGGLQPVTHLMQSLLSDDTADYNEILSVQLTNTSDRNMIGRDPGFIRYPDSGDGDWATDRDNDYGDLSLLSYSPAVDSGQSSNLPIDLVDLNDNRDILEILPVDAEMERRVVGNPDLGAIERR